MDEKELKMLLWSEVSVLLQKVRRFLYSNPKRNPSEINPSLRVNPPAGGHGVKELRCKKK